jgi:hypothetical protein
MQGGLFVFGGFTAEAGKIGFAVYEVACFAERRNLWLGR